MLLTQCKQCNKSTRVNNSRSILSRKGVRDEKEIQV